MERMFCYLLKILLLLLLNLKESFSERILNYFFRRCIFLQDVVEDEMGGKTVVLKWQKRLLFMVQCDVELTK
jgi:hypothetical protein